MDTFVLIFIILLIIIFIIVIFADEDLTKSFIQFFLFIVIITLLCNFFLCQPKAIDVYRNKTTLQITYQDSIPIDSIVVYK